ncbi:MAG: ISLre2 family transposase, partial [Candidatus Marinimicrobia bacterium]|nr:ISLre2 family transposase [Candidatus Neomarinimicrobiota bacterium]
MENIIQQFAENIIPELEVTLEEIYLKNDGGLSKLTRVIKKHIDNLGQAIMKYTLEELDQAIKESQERKKRWVVQRSSDEKTIITEFGEVKYTRTYYKSKIDGSYAYLVDKYMGMEPHQRIDKNLESKLIDLASNYSYAKSAKLAVKEVQLSRQTVMNKSRKLERIKYKKQSEEKKEVAILYVEADEDHISLQDGKKTISKLVYVHEGYEQGQGRNKLKNVHYFSGIYSNPEDLWLEVADYIEENYDTDKIKKVFLSGDGAGWIKEGLNWLPKAKYVLDKYHLNKYVLKATGHVPKLRFELWGGINTLDKTKVKRVFKKIMKKTEAESKIKAVRKSRQYILKNWAGIEAYMKDKDAIGCSAEGHVSHVLADRLSSRPRGWSKIGADQMS